MLHRAWPPLSFNQGTKTTAASDTRKQQHHPTRPGGACAFQRPLREAGGGERAGRGKEGRWLDEREATPIAPTSLRMFPTSASSTFGASADALFSLRPDVGGEGYEFAVEPRWKPPLRPQLSREGVRWAFLSVLGEPSAACGKFSGGGVRPAGTSAWVAGKVRDPGWRAKGGGAGWAGRPASGVAPGVGQPR